MTWWVVFDYGWYYEPYCGYTSQAAAESALFKAKRCRPNTKVKVVAT